MRHVVREGFQSVEHRRNARREAWRQRAGGQHLRRHRPGIPPAKEEHRAAVAVQVPRLARLGDVRRPAVTGDPDEYGAAASAQTLDHLPNAVEVVRRFGGRAIRADLLRHTTAHLIAAAVDSGDLVRVARGLYVLADLPSAPTAAAACRGVLSHESAAAALQLPLLLPPSVVHVTVPRGSRPSPIKNVQVHERDLASSDVDNHATVPLRTVLDCCATMPFREALALADSAARIVPGFLEDFTTAAAAPGRGRRRREQVARHVSSLSSGPFESAVRADLIAARLTDFRPQVTIRAGGEVFRVDLADERRRIVVEADSFAWHGNRTALDSDCRRYNELVRAGWLVLRFSWEQVMFSPDWVVSVVRDVVARAA